MKYYESILTKRENDVMMILWQEDKPLIASEIVTKQEGLTINTVQAILRRLLKKKLIEVGEIVYSGTVLSRAYKPAISQKEFELQATMNSVASLKKFDISAASFASALLGKQKKISQKELEQLEQLIQEKRKNL